MKKLLILAVIVLLFAGCSEDPSSSNNKSDADTFTSYNFEDVNTYFTFASSSTDTIEPAGWDIVCTYIPYYAYVGCQLVMTIKEPVIILGDGLTAARIDAASLDDVTSVPDAELFKEDKEFDPVIGEDWLDESFSPTNEVYAIKTCSGDFALVQFVDYFYTGSPLHQVQDIKWRYKFNSDSSNDFSTTTVDSFVADNAYSDKQYFSFLNGKVTSDDGSDIVVDGYSLILGQGVEAKKLNVTDIESVSTITDKDWELDAPGTVTYDWYVYDHSSHSVTPRDYVYVVHTADDKYAAFEIESIYDDLGEYGVFTIFWKYLD